MDITILKNKNYKKNDYIINKYKFICIENKFSEDILNILYNRFGIIWWYLSSLDKKEIIDLYKNLNEFKKQFEINEFQNELDAKNYLINQKNINNNNILEINKYQIFWDINFKKQKLLYSYNK